MSLSDQSAEVPVTFVPGGGGGGSPIYNLYRYVPL